jgi:hypothetical protein
MTVYCRCGKGIVLPLAPSRWKSVSMVKGNSASSKPRSGRTI